MCRLSTGYGNGKTVSIRVDNFGGMSATTYTLSHEGALAELYSTDITAQVGLGPPPAMLPVARRVRSPSGPAALRWTCSHACRHS